MNCARNDAGVMAVPSECTDRPFDKSAMAERRGLRSSTL
ncbi:hypothetical protein FTUN_7428 [Frigoriglobus tundricola]|uniref:Uncharacterized protein n=1 Tax=Frigoriglobus tundricola TaxID=2774151 RepID=A0A6M5Z0V8_9BACT|nr:hypothetical protein FTUN_7428 [Frigoriglobus tundricola]